VCVLLLLLLLLLLHAGRARLGHVRNGLMEISLSSESVASLLKRASDSIEQRSADLLRDANREAANFDAGSSEDSLSFSLSSSALQRMKREVVSEMGEEYDDFDERGFRHEAAMRQRQKRVEESIGLVDGVEAEFQKLQGEQKVVDAARSAAKATLAAHKARFQDVAHSADDAGVGHVVVLKQVSGVGWAQQAQQGLEV
jgi:predicted DNA binding CopG/RHH family protein